MSKRRPSSLDMISNMPSDGYGMLRFIPVISRMIPSLSILMRACWWNIDWRMEEYFVPMGLVTVCGQLTVLKNSMRQIAVQITEQTTEQITEQTYGIISFDLALFDSPSLSSIPYRHYPLQLSFVPFKTASKFRMCPLTVHPEFNDPDM